MLGYNYRMPNINAAIGCAQILKIKLILSSKTKLAKMYKNFSNNDFVEFFDQPKTAKVIFGFDLF